jgi:hypothetical protein
MFQVSLTSRQSTDAYYVAHHAGNGDVDFLRGTFNQSLLPGGDSNTPRRLPLADVFRLMASMITLTLCTTW